MAQIGHKEHIIQDLEFIYGRAVSDDNLTAALKAKELQGKCLGLFILSKLPSPKLSLVDLSEKNLEELLRDLEEGELPEVDTS